MRINICVREENEAIDLHLSDPQQQYEVAFNELSVVNSGSTNYEALTNKPRINSVVLEGILSARDLGLGNVYYDTTANWNQQLGLIAEEAALYIYSDYSYIEDEQGNITPIAGMKIGDGSSCLIDMPFISEAMSTALIEHMTDTASHTTQAEKDFWNNKVSCFLDGEDLENLIISKTEFVTQGDIYNG